MNNKRRLPLFVKASEQRKKQRLEQQKKAKQNVEPMDPRVQGVFKNEINAMLKQVGGFWASQIVENAGAIAKHQNKNMIDSSDVKSSLEMFNSITSDQEKEFAKMQQLRAERINSKPLPKIDTDNKFDMPKERSNQLFADYKRLNADDADGFDITEKMRSDFHTQRQYKAIDQLVPTVTTIAPKPAPSASNSMLAVRLEVPKPIPEKPKVSKPKVSKAKVSKPSASTVSKSPVLKPLISRPIILRSNASTGSKPIVFQTPLEKPTQKAKIPNSASSIVSTPLVRLQPHGVRAGMQMKSFTLKSPAVFKVPQSPASKFGTPFSSQKKSIAGPYIYGQLNGTEFYNSQVLSPDTSNLTRQSVKKEEADTQVKQGEDTQVKRELSDESHVLL